MGEPVFGTFSARLPPKNLPEIIALRRFPAGGNEVGADNSRLAQSGFAPMHLIDCI